MLNTEVSWDVTPRSLDEVYRSYSESSVNFYRATRRHTTSSINHSTMNIEATDFSENMGPKLSTILHGVTSQTTINLIQTTVGTSNLKCLRFQRWSWDSEDIWLIGNSRTLATFYINNIPNISSCGTYHFQKANAGSRPRCHVWNSQLTELCWTVCHNGKAIPVPGCGSP